MSLNKNVSHLNSNSKNKLLSKNLTHPNLVLKRNRKLKKIYHQTKILSPKNKLRPQNWLEKTRYNRVSFWPPKLWNLKAILRLQGKDHLDRCSYSSAKAALDTRFTKKQTVFQNSQMTYHLPQLIKYKNRNRIISYK